MATLAPPAASGLSFWQKFALGLGLLIVFAFGQFAARGFVNLAATPPWIHAHGVAMLAWLALSFVQPSLVRIGKRALHRRLGWIGVALAAAITLLGAGVGIKTIQIGHVPPFFTPPFFLALTQLVALSFAGMVAAAVRLRRDEQSHQRLMLGATIVILDPAISRILPMPLLGPWGETAGLVVALAIAGLVLRHDRATLGRVHPASWAICAVLVAQHLAVEVLGRTPFMAGLAARIAGG